MKSGGYHMFAGVSDEEKVRLAEDMIIAQAYEGFEQWRFKAVVDSIVPDLDPATAPLALVTAQGLATDELAHLINLAPEATDMSNILDSVPDPNLVVIPQSLIDSTVSVLRHPHAYC